MCGGFSDESRFMLQKRDGRTRVYRRRNERFARNCVLEVDNFGGGSVKMWGAIVPAPYSCTIGPLQIDADVSVLRQNKDVWWVHNRFHGDGF
jgi:hypothetical protein